MNLKLVTGNTVETTVEASDDRMLHAGIVGSGDYVFATGQQFAHEIIDNNTIRIFDGSGITQGSHFLISYGKYDDVSIDTGTSGYNRIDLICVKYTKFQNAETAELTVVKGIETTGTPTAPDVTTGNILQDAYEHNMILKKITIQGTNISSIENAYENAMSIERIGTQKVLWSGQYVMSSSHTITLSELVSKQPHGIVLEFSPYTNETARDYCKKDFFIPKYVVENERAQSRTYFMSLSNFTNVCEKTLYIYDDKIIGTDANATSGTSNGITFDNMTFVLRKVIGV